MPGPRFTPTVGVAPGTTTLQLAGTTVRMWSAYPTSVADLGQLGAVDTRARMRWDIMGVVGGGALLIALTTGLLASAIGK